VKVRGKRVEEFGGGRCGGAEGGCGVGKGGVRVNWLAESVGRLPVGWVGGFKLWNDVVGA